MSVNDVDLNTPPTFLQSGASSDERAKVLRGAIPRADAVTAEVEKDKVELSSEAYESLKASRRKVPTPEEARAREAEINELSKDIKVIFEMQTPQGRLSIDSNGGMTTNSPGLALIFQGAWEKQHEEGKLSEPKDRSEAIAQQIALAKSLFGKTS